MRTRHGSAFAFVCVFKLLICSVCSNVKNCLTIDLECDRAVECDCDLMACLYLNNLCVVNVLALEDGREDGKCSDLSAAVEKKQ